MKKTILILLAILLTATFILTACDSKDTQSTVSEQYANADEYLDRTWGYRSWKDTRFENAIWLATDDFGAFDIKVPLGTVQVSPNLIKAMEDMPDNLRLRVIICFKSMVPENYLDSLSYEGKSYAEYQEIVDTADTIEEVGQAETAISMMKNNYYSELRKTLSFTGEVWYMDGTSRKNFAFYACMTKKEILELTCDEDEAFYVFAAQYK